jgi:hypothetical protein
MGSPLIVARFRVFLGAIVIILTLAFDSCIQFTISSANLPMQHLGTVDLPGQVLRAETYTEKVGLGFLTTSESTVSCPSITVVYPLTLEVSNQESISELFSITVVYSLI